MQAQGRELLIQTLKPRQKDHQSKSPVTNVHSRTTAHLLAATMPHKWLPDIAKESLLTSLHVVECSPSIKKGWRF